MTATDTPADPLPTPADPRGDGAVVARARALAPLGSLAGRRVLVLQPADPVLVPALELEGAIVDALPSDTPPGAYAAIHPDASPWDRILVPAAASLAPGAAALTGDDPAAALAALGALLAPGGSLALEVPNPWGLRHLVISGLDGAAPRMGPPMTGPGAWRARRTRAALDATGLRAQRAWSVFPGFDDARLLVEEDLWSSPGGAAIVRFLARDPVAARTDDGHVELDPVDAFASLLERGLGPELADACLVIAAATEDSLDAAVPSTRLILATDVEAAAPGWRTTWHLDPDGRRLTPATDAAAVVAGTLGWTPAPIETPTDPCGEDELIRTLLRHGPDGAATTRLLEAWWAAARIARERPEGAPVLLEPRAFAVDPQGGWRLVLPSPVARFSMPEHLACFGALVTTLHRRLPTAGVPVGVATDATIGDVAGLMTGTLGLRVDAAGAMLWSVLEADVSVRASGGAIGRQARVAALRARRDRRIGDLLPSMPPSAHLETVRTAADAEARVAATSRSLEERSHELRERTDELAMTRAALAEALGDAERRVGELDVERARLLERIAALEPREVEVERLKAALAANGERIRGLTAELAAERDRFARFRTEVARWTPILPPLRAPGRLRAMRERLRARRVRAEVLRSGWFDEAWYVARYPDVADSGVDPLTHYLDHGWLDGRDPGPRFSSVLYRRRYPDVAVAGSDPLVHHVRHGQAEGRQMPWPAEATEIDGLPGGNVANDRRADPGEVP